MKIATFIGLAAILEQGTSVELQTQEERDFCYLKIDGSTRADKVCRDAYWGYRLENIAGREDEIPEEVYASLKLCRDSTDRGVADWCHDRFKRMYDDYVHVADESMNDE